VGQTETVCHRNVSHLQETAEKIIEAECARSRAAEDRPSAGRCRLPIGNEFDRSREKYRGSRAAVCGLTNESGGLKSHVGNQESAARLTVRPLAGCRLTCQPELNQALGPMPGSPRKVISKHCATRQELFPTTLFLDNLRCRRPLLLDSSPWQSKTKTHQFSTIHRNLLIFATRTKANSADSCDSSAAAALQFDLPSPHSPVPPHAAPPRTLPAKPQLQRSKSYPWGAI
jgi:hypothetical protein